MSKQQSKPKRVTLLDIRTVTIGKGAKQGQKIPKVQFAKGVEVLYNGEKVDLGEYNSAFIKTAKELESDIDFLLDKEYITEEQAEERKERLKDKSITGELQVQLSK